MKASRNLAMAVSLSGALRCRSSQLPNRSGTSSSCGQPEGIRRPVAVGTSAARPGQAGEQDGCGRAARPGAPLLPNWARISSSGSRAVGPGSLGEGQAATGPPSPGLASETLISIARRLLRRTQKSGPDRSQILTAARQNSRHPATGVTDGRRALRWSSYWRWECWAGSGPWANRAG